MQHLNKVELIGTIGAVAQTEKATRLSMITQRVYKTTDGQAVIEATWHTISVPKIDKFSNLSFSKMDNVHLLGFLRQTLYTDKHGVDRSSYEIVATEIEILLGSEK